MQLVPSAGLVPTSASTLSPFAVMRPTSLDAAAAALRAHAGATVLAGGTDLVAAFNEGLSPSLVVDVSRVAALRRIDVADGRLRIGAAVTHAAGCVDPLVVAHAPGFAAAWRSIANPRVRLSATLGGNLMARRARYEGPVLLAALGATLEFADGSACEPSALWTAAPRDALLAAIAVPVANLVWYGYERSLRPLLTVATAVRRTAGGLALRAAVATEYLRPAVVETPLRAGAPVGRDEAHALLAQLPADFEDPVVDARYARDAAAALVARQLSGVRLD